MTISPRARWAIPLVLIAVVAIGLAISQVWRRNIPLTRSDYVGTIDVSADDAKLYREVTFEWRVTSPAGDFKGTDMAYIRVDPSGERTVICGWIRQDKAGASIRASRWLSEAYLTIGDLRISATFVAPVQAVPGDGLNAGCAGLYDGLKPPMQAPLALDGPAVHE